MLRFLRKLPTIPGNSTATGQRPPYQKLTREVAGSKLVASKEHAVPANVELSDPFPYLALDFLGNLDISQQP